MKAKTPENSICHIVKVMGSAREVFLKCASCMFKVDKRAHESKAISRKAGIAVNVVSRAHMESHSRPRSTCCTL